MPSCDETAQIAGREARPATPEGGCAPQLPSSGEVLFVSFVVAYRRKFPCHFFPFPLLEDNGSEDVDGQPAMLWPPTQTSTKA